MWRIHARRASAAQRSQRSRSCAAWGPDLTSGKWLWGDGSLAAITRTIEDGVPNPKNHANGMPPKGGAELSSSQVAAAAAYVWALSHESAH